MKSFGIIKFMIQCLMMGELKYSIHIEHREWIGLQKIVFSCIPIS